MASNPYMHCNPIPNFDTAAGIHYGVIGQRDCMPEAVDDIYTQGTDLGYEAAVEQIKGELKAAITNALSDYVNARHTESAIDDAVNALWDDVSDDYDYGSGGDVSPHRYDQQGYLIDIDSQGDLFIIKSPYYTERGLCSPCAPNAGHLLTPGGNKTYCLGFNWFDEHNPAPYDRIFEVGTDEVTLRPNTQGGATQEPESED